MGGFTICHLGLLQIRRSGTALAGVMVEFRVLRAEYKAKNRITLTSGEHYFVQGFYWKYPVGYVPGEESKRAA